MENGKIKNQNKTSLDHYFGEGAIGKKVIATFLSLLLVVF
jgi:hypothetical protein